jgi:hypothetical protein
VQKARRKETTRKTRTVWVKYIKMELGDMAWCGKDWSDSLQGRVQRRAVLNGTT